MSEAEPDDDYLDPKWEEGGRVHNWRNYVPENVRAIWDTFTPNQKLVLSLWADDFAGRENWD
jgi:hypothetical protein